MPNKSEVARAVASRIGMTIEDARRAVDAAVEIIVDSLVAGQKVQIAGLGVFTVKPTKARVGRSVMTGAPIDIPAGRAIKFKVGADVKGRM